MKKTRNTLSGFSLDTSRCLSLQIPHFYDAMFSKIPMKFRRATGVAFRCLLVFVISFSLSPISHVAYANDPASTGSSINNIANHESLSNSSNSSEAETVPGELIVALKADKKTDSEGNNVSSQVTNEEAVEAIERVADKDLDASQSVKSEALDISELKGIDVASAEVISTNSLDNSVSLSVSVSDVGQTNELKDRLSADENVAYVQPNYIYHLADTSDNTKSTGAIVSGIVSKVMEVLQNKDAFIDYQYALNNWDSKDPWGTTTGDNNIGANVKAAWEYVDALDGISDGNMNLESVTVAVLDSGCYMDHPDFTYKVGEETRSHVLKDYAYNAVNNTTDVTDNVGHGTHVCGIIAAAANNGYGVAGSSYNANIIPIKVADDNGDIPSAALIEAYTKLKANFSDDTIDEADNLRVINMSLGHTGGEGEDDKTLHASIQEMYDTYNVLTVCAAGNIGDSKNGYGGNVAFYPGEYDECLSVTALNSDGADAYYSNYGGNKNISAPGTGILSTVPPNVVEYTPPRDNKIGGDIPGQMYNNYKDKNNNEVESFHSPFGYIPIPVDKDGKPVSSSSDNNFDHYAYGLENYVGDYCYGYLDGTSQASPLVAGIAAFLFAMDSTLTAKDVFTIIMDTARPVKKGNEYNYYYGSPYNRVKERAGAGAIDAKAAAVAVAIGKAQKQEATSQ